MAVNNNTRQDVNFIPPFQPNGRSIPDNIMRCQESIAEIFNNIDNNFLKSMFFIKKDDMPNNGETYSYTKFKNYLNNLALQKVFQVIAYGPKKARSKSHNKNAPHLKWVDETFTNPTIQSRKEFSKAYSPKILAQTKALFSQVMEPLGNMTREVLRDLESDVVRLKEQAGTEMAEKNEKELTATTTKIKKKKKKKKKKKSKAGRHTLCRSPIDKRLISSSSPINIRNMDSTRSVASKTFYSSSSTSTRSMDSFDSSDTELFDSSSPTNQRFFDSSSPVDIKLFNSSIPTEISDAARISDVLNCPSNKPTTKVAKRVYRWLNSSRADIREFTDRKNGRVNQYYLNYADTDIDRHRAYHHLSGIERIISNPETKEMYCREFYKDEQRHLHLNATVSYKGSNDVIVKADGQVHVIIGSNDLLYHAKFQPNAVLQNDEEKDEWTTQGDLVFEINKDNTLSMKFPNDRQNIHYTFFPVDLDNQDGV